jgi:hypothetical protein
MSDLRIALDSLTVDENGRVILGDEKLEALVADAGRTVAGGQTPPTPTPNIACANAGGCVGSLNDGCANRRRCDNSTNYNHTCWNGY